MPTGEGGQPTLFYSTGGWKVNGVLPEMPFSVMTTSGFRWIMSSQSCWMYSSSIWRIRVKSSSLVISMSVCVVKKVTDLKILDK